MEHPLARNPPLARIATRSTSRRWLVWCCVLFAALVAAELLCRAFGLHQTVLYEPTEYGYRAIPNQELRRFGNRVFYNSFGLRSEATTALPAAGVWRVLCIGDSIANGGAITDQDDTYPYQMQRLLRAAGQPVEVLNASAPGWAIENAQGWLRDNGVFGSKVVILTIGDLDLFQERAGPEIVNSHPSFPGASPAFALEELVKRYLLPRLLSVSFVDPGARAESRSPQASRDRIDRVLAMARLSEKQGAKFMVLFVAQPESANASDPVAAAATASLFQALSALGIAYVETRVAVRQGGGLELFRDQIHPNAKGNRLLAELAAGMLVAPVASSKTGKK